MINGERVDALAGIVHRERAYAHGRASAENTQEVIPRQMYEVAIRSSVGSRVLARETVKALRENVTARCSAAR